MDFLLLNGACRMVVPRNILPRCGRRNNRESAFDPADFKSVRGAADGGGGARSLRARQLFCTFFALQNDNFMLH